MEVPFQSVAEILTRSRGGDLLRYLIDKFAAFSGISGVQPKILVRDELGQTRLGAGPAHVGAMLKRVDAALAATAAEVNGYMKKHAEFREIGRGAFAAPRVKRLP